MTLIEPWKLPPLILLLVSIATVHSRPPKVQRVTVARLEDDNRIAYRYSTHGMVTEGQWQQLTSANMHRGDLSFFTAYTDPYPSEGYIWDRKGGFEKAIYVCHYRSRTWVMTSRPCEELGRSWSRDSVFYAAQEQKPYTQAIYITLCEADDFVYGTVSTQHQGCERRHRAIGWDVFYAFHGSVMCPFVNLPVNGYIAQHEFQDGVKVKKVFFRCSPGYKMTGPSAITCDYSGRWSSGIPQCTPISCQKPRIPYRGQLVGDSYTYNSQVTFTCEKGYRVAPEGATIQCMSDGHWTDIDARCLPISCNFPGEIPNGDVLGGDFTFGRQVRFRCDPSYALHGYSKARCRSNGQWSRPLPVCKQIACSPVEQPKNGARVGDDFSAGRELIFQCHEGYRLVGQAVIKCEADDQLGRWSAEPPVCEKIQCSEPNAIANGDGMGTDFSYGKEVKFVCHRGYVLEGAATITCLQSGWDSPAPICRSVLCDVPSAPAHGEMSGEVFNYGAVVSFKCDDGYHMEGKRSLICDENGAWSGQVPTCTAVQCPPIEHPEFGTRDGSVFEYGENVTFSCYPGYQIHGNITLKCQADGSWSHERPTCKACPLGFYKPTADSGPCLACPKNSTTVSEGSFSAQHCNCDERSERTENQTCKVIECDELTAPENGTISECGHFNGDECHFTCQPGYVVHGSRIRKCTKDGWTGAPAQCTACPANTYKHSEGSVSCTPCPVHSEVAAGEGISMESCQCESGYMQSNTSESLCVDVNECEENNGGCSDACENIPGGFFCGCSIPGYVLDSDNKTCKVNQTCSPLDQNPDHGYIQCRHHLEQNGHICYIKCNASYFFVSGVNNYLTCGPDTEFVWSHQRVNKTARIASCTREFFIDITLPIQLRYKSTSSCNSLVMSPRQLRVRIEDTVQALDACKGLCSVENLESECDDAENEQGSEISVKFNVFLKNPDENAISPSCDPVCKRRNMRQMLGQTFKMKNGIENLVSEKPTDFELGDQTSPALDNSSFKFSRPQMLCEKGRVLTKNRLCVPCDVGYYLPKRDMTSCEPCPQGTYQDQQGQTSCKLCLPGSSTLTVGADHPSMCSVRVTQININTSNSTLNHEDDYTDEEDADVLIRL